MVGARIMLTYGDYDDGSHPGLNAIVAAAGRAGVPVNIMSTGKMHVVGELARRNPNAQLVIDHVGLAQPRHPPAPPEPFELLDDVLSLAEYDNVAIKISGACTLAHEPFPYPDIWEPLGRMFEAFGFERCLWGTDWTRAINVLTYEQGVEAFRVTDTLSDSERAMLMGRGADEGLWLVTWGGRIKIHSPVDRLPDACQTNIAGGTTARGRC